MGILDADLINGTPEEEFAFNVLQFSKNYDKESWQALTDYAKKHFTKQDRKLCWRKHHYFAITRNEKSRRWNGEKYVECDAPRKIIIASECLIKNDWGNYDCVTFRCTGKTGPKDRRGQWFPIYRSQENPVLSTGYKFSEYDIYQIPTELISFLWDFLPHKPKKLQKQ